LGRQQALWAGRQRREHRRSAGFVDLIVKQKVLDGEKFPAEIESSLPKSGD
jgi:hypothetical protein